MQVTVLSENLQKRISLLQHAISSKSQLPILQNILLKAKNGVLELSATDLDIGVQITIPAKIEVEGAIAVPARAFIELINSLPAEKILIEYVENNLNVIGSKTTSVFQVVSQDEFPTLYETLGEKIAEVSSQVLQDEFSKVIFAASIDSARPALTGVLMQAETQGFLLVATDAFRLSLNHVLASEANEVVSKPILVQARLLREVSTLKETEAIAIYLHKDTNQIIFKGTNETLVGRLIDAQFPNYENIIPTEHSLRASLDKDELHKAVKLCAIFARETDNIIRFSFHNDKLTVSAQTASIGKNSAEVATLLEGEENDIAFNGKYLLDFLSHIEDKELVFEMQGPLNPGVFKVKGSDSFLHIIMPIRVQS